MTILIVDDENAEAYSTVIEDNFDTVNSFILLTANTEEDAFTLINENKIDIAIVDLCINSNDNAGIDVVRYLKEKDSSIVAILITAYPEKLDMKHAYALGVYFCITKSSEISNTYTELFNTTKNAIEYKKKLEQLADANKLDLLKKFFDPYVLKQYEHSHLSLLPAERSVTVAFWDIRGFTTVTEALIKYPTLISDFLKDFFNSAAEVIFNNHGVLDKFIGDGIMTIFGAFDGDDEQTVRENALRAVKAAFEIRTVFTSVYENWLPKWRLKTNRPINVGLGCGINTGESIVGLMGTDERNYFTAIGHEVNVTSRIEGTAEKGQIRISQRTYEITQEYIDVRSLGSLELKHVNDVINIYEILKLRRV